jgi:hypothetical protein
MFKVGMISPLFLIPFYAYQIKYVKAVWEFKQNEGTPQSAKKLKKTSYMPFVILLLGFVGSTTYKRY